MGSWGRNYLVAERRGTVTFLFTDVEGSTRLLKQLRDGYSPALEEHQRILRGAFAAHGGEEVDTQGDAFFYVFPRARAAAEAAAEAQRGLAAHPWPNGSEFRVRIGIHTGEPLVSDEGRYYGLSVHRTARIMAAGHGGQILLSQATASVLEDDEPAGIGLKNLGEHRLKDLDRPEHIYQLEVDGLPATFPPIRTLDEAAGSPAPGWRRAVRSRPGVVVGIAAALTVALVAGVIVLVPGRGSDALSHINANALGFVDPANGTISAQAPVGATPSHVAVGGGAIWVTNADGDSVSRVDPRTHALIQTIPVGSSPSGITVGDGAVWVANSLDGTVSRIDPSTNSVRQTIRVGNAPVGIAFAAGSIWVANTGDNTTTMIDPATGRRSKTLPIATFEFAFGAGTLWASDLTGNQVTRIDPASGQAVSAIQVGNGPQGIAFGDGAAWVTNSLSGTVMRIDPTTDSIVGTVRVGNGPTAVAVGADGAWVSNEFDGTLVRIDPRTNQVGTRISVGNRPQGVAISNGAILVGVRPSGAGHRGGTLTVRMNRDLDSIDPAIAYDSTSWSVLRMTNDGLVAFNQASGVAGTQLVPDLAVSLPTPTEGGRTYTFHLRSGIRYSNGGPVRASDVRSTLERAFELGTPVPEYYTAIAGATGCVKRPETCDLSSGIVSDDATGTVTFHLVKPDPEFLDKLAMPFADVVPAGSPATLAHTHPLPATGPYMILSYRPHHLLTLVRNPRFHEWSKAAQPDGYPDIIALKIGGTPDGAVNDVIRGAADVFDGSQSETPPSPALLARIEVRHASQVHTNPQPATVGIFLNTRLLPFKNLDARRALNYAADRSAAVRAFAGPSLARPTCQFLPPGFPGYLPYCPYTAGSTTRGIWTSPDLMKARHLVAVSGTKGMRVTVWSWGDLGGLGPFMVKLVRSLGYRVSLKVVNGTQYFPVVSDSRTRAQIGTNEWISDYPKASGFFVPILTCGSYLPKNPYNANDSAFCNRRIDDEVAASDRLGGHQP